MNRDILVIGAGVLGLSSAYHLKRKNPEKKVLVIDKFPGPGQGNTAKSAGIFLNLLASETNYFLADSTTDWLFHLQNELGYKLDLVQHGYLYLLSDTMYRNSVRTIEKMRNNGVEIKVFDEEDLKRMIPELETEFGEDETGIMGLEPVKFGVLGVKCGSVNTDALAHCLESEFIKLGGEVLYNTTAKKLILKPEKELGLLGEPFIWQDAKVVGAETIKGNIQADLTVVAGGVWSERLLDQIGVDSLMRPKKRNIFVFKDNNLRGLQRSKGFNSYDILPFTNIPEISVYMKVDMTEDSIWLGCSDDFGRKYELEDDPQPETKLYGNNIYYALSRYLPCFKDVRPINMWAGQRAINKYDYIPVVETSPGMIYVGSASGYGICKFDALGRTVAAVYSNEEVELYSGRRFKASILGVQTRSIERETFHI
jgi:glycine/D-amino acid oxidase-like deaminating enzyme